MIRITRGNIAATRRKKYLKLAKGYLGVNSRLSTFACEQVIQGLNFAYISRRLKKRDLRKIWIQIINVATRNQKRLNNYSTFFGLLKSRNIFLNRKMLAYLIFNDLPVFNLINRYLYL